ncbi:MAG: aminotransferase class I/II-fold pyridoxal phosphate-dependent enzyme [Hydrogenophaga sp.]|uniref:pyridoxal phosphate-dependent aminotransferase n=1 Tax=Hydrogenophaga sp. TaxID=1904254 RepID=UPI0016A68B51|nr:pyridoxal phosphate-dependent aminotransferase [Hydrogenophaga sp.]NIM41313.1 aminotransferase class I/II-fold pyridoxal phosphate-dependent enzyme [Hydrogenophaga sp.]NIN26629.1 aminotransferase class I/II-fold pyridoxal phosphate-dependent enzyme [Hydrogenophaga sp.]NIN29951.1 aminotransferase class I/II-fold pyridoxal phosphate-dependent enzyme [Hydrogenophaga sp.]NIN55559.1 aminotransferase class I/II-fold pyridoxal phosphate-dependent enzyme [Hydrogenophaga sp.]NIO52556.1 aminotransfer
MRDVVAGLEGSRIREVANEGIGREGVLKFWFGESDEVTPEPIRQAAIASLQAGETFYAHNLGLPELREAIAGYTDRLHPGRGSAHWFGRLAVTSGGVNGLMLAAQTLVNASDEVVVLTPAWPNLVAQPLILGARVRSVSLVPRGGAWTLDLEALRQAVTPATRVLIINAPANPTGFTLTADQQRAILAHCRTTGTWIVADEVYERLYFEGDASNEPAPGRPKPDAPWRGEGRSPSGGRPICAPSFLDVAEADDRLIVAHSFSKSFLMTGWRLGWLVLPPALTEAVGKLIEFNTSCAPVFVQRGAIAAIAHGDAVTPALVAHLRHCRDTLVPLLQALPGVELATPRAGMYAFFRLPGQADCLDVAKRLVREAGLGLAPGSAFAPEAAGWLRWCFASRDVARLEEGVRRLRGWFEGQGKA